MTYLTLFTAISIAAVAAWYSIVGLMAIFAGAVIPIAIMGGVLEVGKLVTAAWLHQNWRKASLWMRSYLTSAVFVLMVITSLGIFGFLSKAHLEHSISTGGTNVLQITNLERQIDRQYSVITDAETVLAQLDSQVATLIEYDRIRGPSGSIAVRERQSEERSVLNEKIDAAYIRIEELQGLLTPLQQEKLAIEVEVGPLKYIAELIYGDGAEDYFDEAVRIVIILLIVTFDPLAVVLLLAATQGFTQREQDKIRAFNPDNVVDLEDKYETVNVDMSKYRFVEDSDKGPWDEWFEDDLPSDEDISDYEVMGSSMEDAGHGVDLDEEPAPKPRRTSGAKMRTSPIRKGRT